ncbi:MAG: hypothetical protein BWK76_11695 [Desulfobulbaceae bacterium A2]|nr:MAG: hypothetical protein BWK76_11695 [Desulfobulbaceae bacterium A2]
MENDSSQSEPPPLPERPIWERLKAALGIDRGPDTTEDLEQEIQELLEEGEAQGLIGSMEERLIGRIFDFSQTVASEIMTPAAEMVCADEKTPAVDLIRLVCEEGYTRVPIYRDTLDHIVGILHVKDLLHICTLAPDQPLQLDKFLNPPYFISETKPVTELLCDFQARKTHLAIVTDEFGGVRGLVTLEDVIEVIVGEIDDEHDQEEAELTVVDENTIVVDAKIDIEEVEAHFAVEFPEGPYESIGGLVIHRLGKVPAGGALVELEGLVFRVLAADRRRIKTVRISRNPV